MQFSRYAHIWCYAVCHCAAMYHVRIGCNRHTYGHSSFIITVSWQDFVKWNTCNRLCYIITFLRQKIIERKSFAYVVERNLWSVTFLPFLLYWEGGLDEKVHLAFLKLGFGIAVCSIVNPSKNLLPFMRYCCKLSVRIVLAQMTVFWAIRQLRRIFA